MAHSRKRKRGNENVTDLKLEDVMCPICRSIIIEPVSLPCEKHILCYFCFEKTIENNTLTCPICRKRIGSWLRSATKNRSLINSKLWIEIQEKFPEQVKRKQNGEDDGIEEQVVGSPIVTKCLSTPGEIKQEFEDQLRKYSHEIIREKELEEKASFEFIHKLLKTEIYEDEERKKGLQEVIQRDETFAKSLQSSTSIPVPEKILDEKKPFKVTKLDNNINKKSKKINTSRITIENYFGTQTRSSSSNSANSSTSSRNSIDAEFSHFKPIIREPKTPPKKLPDGSILDSRPRRIQPLNLDLLGKFDVPKPNLKGPNILSSDGPKAFSRIQPSIVYNSTVISTSSAAAAATTTNTTTTTTTTTTIATATITSDNQNDEDTDFENDSEMTFSDPGPSTSSLVAPSSVTCDTSLQLYSVLEEELRLRLHQEEQDRKLAEYLQNIWDSENKQQKEKLRSDYELRSRPNNTRSTTTVTSVGRQTTLDKHVQPVTF
ncbi:E3 ubiquitin-protein ligase RNF169-like [Lycorma delicatula]|uniref:E3 ubiquitin-protein ligase RNF169-like n=1 Tax=Lycorma delicatula TaxID=130591 RepID=UPI003F518E6C